MEHADNRRECYEWVVSLSPVRNMSTGRENTRMNLAKPMSIGSPQMPQQPSEVTALAPSLSETSRGHANA